MSLRITTKSISAVLRSEKPCKKCGKTTRALSGFCREDFLERFRMNKRKRPQGKPPKKSGRFMHENATTEELIDAYKDLL